MINTIYHEGQCHEIGFINRERPDPKIEDSFACTDRVVKQLAKLLEEFRSAGGDK